MSVGVGTRKKIRQRKNIVGGNDQKFGINRRRTPKFWCKGLEANLRGKGQQKNQIRNGKNIEAID